MAKNSGQNKPPKGTSGVNGSSVTEFEERLRQWSVDQGQLSIPEVELYEKLERTGDPGDQMLLEDAIDAIQAGRMQKSTKRYGGYIETLAGSHRSQARIAGMTGESGTYINARSQTRVPSHILHSRINQRQRQIGDIREQISTVMGDLPGGVADEETMGRVGGLTSQMSGLEYSIAEDRAVLREQRRIKQDPQGRTRRAEGLLDRSGKYLRGQDISTKAAAGEYGSLGDNVAAYQSTRQKFEQVNRLRERAEERQSKNLDKINALYDKHATKLEDLGGIIDAINQTGDGGGGSFWGKAAGALGIGGVAAGTAASGVNAANAYWTFKDLTLPMEKRQMQTGMAGLYNRQYANMEAAAGGDATAMFKLMAANSQSADFAGQMQAETIKSQKRGMWGTALGYGAMGLGGLAVLGGGLAAATGVGAVPGAGLIAGGGKLAIAGSIMAGVSTAVGAGFQGASKLSIAGLDIEEQLTAGRQGLAAYDTQENFATSMNKINLTTQQKYMNQLKGAGAASRGMGGSRGTMMGSLMDAQFLDSLQTFTPQQATELANMARVKVGGAQLTPNMLQSAEAWQRGGVLQGAEYIGNMGALATVGGSNADMETILRRAVEAGMDNSKNVGQMVAATVQMASADAKMGLQTSMGVSTLMQKAIQGSNLPANMRAGAAANALGGLNNMVGGLGDDMYSQIQYSQLAGKLDWLDGDNYTETLAYKKLNLQQAQTLAGGGAKGSQLANRLGLSSMVDSQGNIRQDRATQLLQVKRDMGAMQTVGFDFFGGKQREAIQKFLTTGEATGGYSSGQLSAWARQAAFIRNVPGAEIEGILGPGGAREKGMNAVGGLTNAYEVLQAADAGFQRKQLEHGRKNYVEFYDTDGEAARVKDMLLQRKNAIQNKLESQSVMTPESFQMIEQSQQIDKVLANIGEIGSNPEIEALFNFARGVKGFTGEEENLKKRQQEGAKDIRTPGSVFEKDAKAFHGGMDDLVKGIKKFNDMMKKYDGKNKVTDSLKENDVYNQFNPYAD